MATEHVDNPQDALSALADGQLRGEAFARAVERVTGNADAQATWHTYHVVGDVLRSNDLAFCADDQDFLARFQARLAQEPVLAPVVNATNLIAISAYKSSAEAIFYVEDSVPDSADRPAANVPQFQWKWVAGLASVVAVAAVGWNVLLGVGGGSPAQQMAQIVNMAEGGSVDNWAAYPGPQASGAASPVGTESAVMLRDARLDALMAAHKQIGGTSALQMPAGFLRNATFESSAP